ncbi:acetylxylan esterase [Kiritimatiellaeota bacterium B1221]|nr:acetylxylan esterase [Kiritimatiellaeota bacterium B1221]
MKYSSLLLVFLLGFLPQTLFASAFAILGSTNKDVAIYEPGEEMIFTFKVVDDGEPIAGKKLTWTRTGDDGKTEKGEGIAGVEGLQVTTQMDVPGFVRLQVKAFDEEGERLEGYVGGWGKNKQGKIFFDGGACVDPENLKAGSEPEDFDEFWAGMKEKLAAVPMEAERKELDVSTEQVKVYAVSIACAGDRPVTGYLSVPVNAEPGSLKAAVYFHGYGVRKHMPTGWKPTNAIVFNVNAHGMELGREDAYYDQLKQDLKGYAFDKEENSDPETAYFHDMSLRVMRAFEYVKSLPEWDGKNLESNGGSQGGLQGLWGAGLVEGVSSTNNWSPWCCDLGGDTRGRMEGWQPEYTDALAYYDPVFHVRRAQAKIHMIANYGDYTCPPSGVWTVYNEIPHANKSMEVKQGCTHSYTMKPYMSFTMTPAGATKVGMKDK